MTSAYCFKCNTKISDFETMRKVPRLEECPSCRSSLHSCKMCFFYEKNAYNECREPIASRIVEKDRANFCDLFALRPGKSLENSSEDLLKNANSLFKD